MAEGGKSAQQRGHHRRDGTGGPGLMGERMDLPGHGLQFMPQAGAVEFTFGDQQLFPGFEGIHVRIFSRSARSFWIWSTEAGKVCQFTRSRARRQ